MLRKDFGGNMQKVALVTGVTGQDGAYLSELLLKNNYKVYGFIARRVNQSYENLEYLNILDKLNFVFGDLTDPSSINNAIKSIRPDEVYNLGAMSFVGHSWVQPIYTTEVNGLGTLNFLEAIRNFSPESSFYQASTSEMYGNNWDEDLFQRESTNFRPRSPYGTAKVFAHNTAVNYRESYGLNVCCGILFNHESPLRGLEFVTRKVTNAVAKIHLGQQKYIELGNLNSERDWGFAGDYVKAMYKMTSEKLNDDFVVATGKLYSIKDLLKVSFNSIGIQDYSRYIKINPDFIRPAEVPYLRGDFSKAKEKLNWEPEKSFEDMILEMVNADIKRIKN